jgi:hypothetical protein
MKPRTKTSHRSLASLTAEVDLRARAWREAAHDARDAFRRWSAAGSERDTAAAAYLAAIEREEKAADEYSRASHAYAARCRIAVRVTPGGRNHRRWRLTYDR